MAQPLALEAELFRLSAVAFLSTRPHKGRRRVACAAFDSTPERPPGHGEPRHAVCAAVRGRERGLSQGRALGSRAANPAARALSLASRMRLFPPPRPARALVRTPAPRLSQGRPTEGTCQGAAGCETGGGGGRWTRNSQKGKRGVRRRRANPLALSLSRSRNPQPGEGQSGAARRLGHPPHRARRAGQAQRRQVLPGSPWRRAHPKPPPATVDWKWKRTSVTERGSAHRGAPATPRASGAALR